MAAARDKRKSREDEEPGEGWSSPAGGAGAAKPSGLRGTPDNRKSVLELHPETWDIKAKHVSQKAAAASVGVDDSRMSKAIRTRQVLTGSLWVNEHEHVRVSEGGCGAGGAAGKAAGSGAGARCFRSAQRAAGRRCESSENCAAGRRLVVAIDFGHAGTGYAMAYKDAPGLCLPGNAKMSLPSEQAIA